MVGHPPPPSRIERDRVRVAVHERDLWRPARPGRCPPRASRVVHVRPIRRRAHLPPGKCADGADLRDAVVHVHGVPTERTRSSGRSPTRDPPRGSGSARRRGVTHSTMSSSSGSGRWRKSDATTGARPRRSSSRPRSRRDPRGRGRWLVSINQACWAVAVLWRGRDARETRIDLLEGVVGVALLVADVVHCCPASGCTGGRRCRSGSARGCRHKPDTRAARDSLSPPRAAFVQMGMIYLSSAFKPRRFPIVVRPEKAAR